MQIEDINSPTYSISSQVLKLNSSSAASESSAGHLSKPIVFFQEFTPHNNNLLNTNLFNKQSFPKKQLTIEIDQFVHTQSNGQSTNTIKETQHYVDNNNKGKFIQHQYIETTYKNREHTRKSIEQARQKKEIEVSQMNMISLIRENQQLKTLLKKKDQIIEMQIIRNQQLSLRLASNEQQKRENQFYDDKLREKETKYRQLQKIHEKIVVMNKGLQRELRDNEKKIMELERQVQKNVCLTQSENIAKIKQSSVRLKESSLKVLNPVVNNKENTFSNTIKSVQKKKGTSTSHPVKKSSRIVSSTLNMAKKLQIKNI